MAEVKIEEQLEKATEIAVEAEPEVKPKAKRATRKKTTTAKSSTDAAAKKTTAKKTTAKKTAAKKTTTRKTTTRKTATKKTAAAAKAEAESKADDAPQIDALPTSSETSMNGSVAPGTDDAKAEAVSTSEDEGAIVESQPDGVEEIQPVAEESTAKADSSSEVAAEAESELAQESSDEAKVEQPSSEEKALEEVIEEPSPAEDVIEVIAEATEEPEAKVDDQTDDSDDSDEETELADMEAEIELLEAADESAESDSDDASEDASEDDSEDVLGSEDLADIVAQANTLSDESGRSDSKDRRPEIRTSSRYESKHDRVESPLGARTIVELEAMHLDELRDLARAMSVTGYTRLKKYDLVMRLLRANAELQGHIFGGGILETVQDGIGFLRSDHLLPGPEDVYVSQSQIRRFAMRTGDLVIGQVRPPKDTEKYFSLLKVEAVNGIDPEEGKRRTVFEKLTPIFPNEQLYLETKPNIISTRLIDILSPIGRGQRGLIVSPPKAGKTTILKRIANGISANYSDLHLMVVLIGERPEEVTDMDRSVEAEVVSSTFDEPVQSHVRVAEMAMARAKRLVENQQDVVILLDSVTRLSRAYNLTVPASGRTLSGGIDPAALYPPKRFFGAARNIEEGGSLTIIATCLVDTGSRMDDVIYEEFKGTGNMELTLSRRLGERRIFPAIDIEKSSTRAEEKLLGTEKLAKVYTLRRMIDAMGGGHEALLPIIERMSRTRTNDDFLETLTKR